MLKVYKTCCKNCLLSKSRIVSPNRAKQIVSDCSRNQTHFICHKSDDIVCRQFYDKLGYVSQMIRIAKRLNSIEFIEQTDSEKLITFEEMKIR